MIECCNENLLKRKRRRKRPLKILLFIIILGGFATYYNYIVITQIESVCEDFFRSVSTECSNNAVLLSLEKPVEYSDLITVEKNNDGDIVMMSANSYKMNYIGRSVAENIKKLIDIKIENGVPVPIMSFTGVRIFSGYGVKVNFKTVTVSDVKCAFKSKFEGCGINQTIHSIYVEAVCTVNLNIPLNARKIETESQILLCESVLIGKVPQTYLNGKLFG